MPILAYSKDSLVVFNNLLHDLYFDVPRERLTPVAGRICIRLTDQDFVIHKEWVSDFSLSICEVERADVKGDVNALPGQVELNRIVYQPGEGLLILKAVHPFQIICKVQRLHLELEQLV